MKFRVSKITDYICDGCGVMTRVVPKRVYDTADMMCNCIPEGELFPKAEIAALSDKLVDDSPKPLSNSKVARYAGFTNKDKQALMFEEKPKFVIDKNVFSRAEVKLYMENLKWQELCESAKNNGVVKQPHVKREELEEMVLDAIFGDNDTVEVEEERENET